MNEMSESNLKEYSIKESIRLENIRRANEILEELRINEQYGLVKGQRVKRHTRTDPRTGKKFVAGGGGTGSPESVLVEGKTVSASGIDVVSPGGKVQGIFSKDSIFDPDVLQTVIKNLENSRPQELEEMGNDLFDLPLSIEKGYLSELLLKEIIRRGIVGVNESKAKDKEEPSDDDDDGN